MVKSSWFYKLSILSVLLSSNVMALEETDGDFTLWGGAEDYPALCTYASTSATEKLKLRCFKLNGTLGPVTCMEESKGDIGPGAYCVMVCKASCTDKAGKELYDKGDPGRPKDGKKPAKPKTKVPGIPKLGYDASSAPITTDDPLLGD